ncbi:hypothetical protein EVAR_55318_1 [Eumeta japonica]|uniref:Uncharacterized protein n=1 Tax=Eumeta variegata TaxID=151549 RepID=A0A4C1ZBW7_EUMVA|nr:hypothetical protein EVAR_55318_1 [Eumeta japonica]
MRIHLVTDANRKSMSMGVLATKCSGTSLHRGTLVLRYFGMRWLDLEPSTLAKYRSAPISPQAERKRVIGKPYMDRCGVHHRHSGKSSSCTRF